MTDIDDAPAPITRRSLRANARARRPWRWSHTAVVLMAAIGTAVLMYPTAASWFSASEHDTDIDGYVQSVAALKNETTDNLLADARRYNENLPAGPLRDPYALTVNGQQTAVGEGADAYFNTLKLPGTEAMARVRIAKIGVDLPIFHGTGEDTLARGVGHLYGSALPVGGEGTHAVLTAHNGFVQATLFDNIDQLADGDLIIITTLGDDLYYEVDQIQTVTPDDAEPLRQVPGKDYITLVTCTPTGVNTHRLLVRAERVPAPPVDATRTILTDATTPAGFPWWALVLVAVPAVAAILVMPRRSNPDRSGRSGANNTVT